MSAVIFDIDREVLISLLDKSGASVRIRDEVVTRTISKLEQGMSQYVDNSLSKFVNGYEFEGHIRNSVTSTKLYEVIDDSVVSILRREGLIDNQGITKKFMKEVVDVIMGSCNIRDLLAKAVAEELEGQVIAKIFEKLTKGRN